MSSTGDTASLIMQGAPAAPEIEWDETRLNASLGRLQEMHVQLRQLRETIPAIMRPLHTQHVSPEDLYDHMAQTARNAVVRMKAFNSYMKDPKSQEILEKAAADTNQSSETVSAWLVTQHPNWLDKNIEDGVNDLRIEEEQKDLKEEYDEGEDEDAATLLDSFRGKHPDMEIYLDQAGHTIKLYLPPPTCTTFHIDLRLNPESNKTYTITTEESSHLHSGILKAITERFRNGDLSYLLEMIASYSDVKTTPCQKCNNLLDFEAHFPVVRSKRIKRTSENNNITRWEASHVGCN